MNRSTDHVDLPRVVQPPLARGAGRQPQPHTSRKRDTQTRIIVPCVCLLAGFGEPLEGIRQKRSKERAVVDGSSVDV